MFLTEDVASRTTASKTPQNQEAIVGQAEGVASDVLQDFADDISGPDGTIQLLNNKFMDLVRRVGILEDTSAGTAYFIQTLKDTLDEDIKNTGVNHIRVRHRPRLLSDNGPCYLSGKLKSYLEKQGMAHTRGAPYQPMTQGKIERYHRPHEKYG